ncbi:SpoIIIAH-like family protein [Pseudoneobacillus rhizosphaerae]|uniref:Stage III sporulation protein AH n=1 Tax=Pseudoneobacillus rhizosphaerae TaxID=2880968 RepID=A0A9C7GBB7_9BACI|nr:SpoIIIAH-like family protein [Pseudoneobacillus rhizosphaerae]CAG9609309.1 Stage III sporulation protein AH [Pseudoneobacillus rhizosphaerae]
MLLKKQTVWLLTMLSLVVVLSVYYITSPEQQKMTDMANVEEKQDGAMTTDVTSSEKDDTIISGIASDEEFETLRMELENFRSERKEKLEAIMASTDLPSDQRNAAYDEFNELDDVAKNEAVIETMIRASLGYEDALVRADGGKIVITVKAEKKSAKAANDIIKLVKDEIGMMQYVTVDFKTEE